MKKKDWKSSVGKGIVKLIVFLLCFPLILLLLLFALGSFLIDLISQKSDSEFLSDKEIRKRKIDRTNKRRHDFLGLVVSLLKW